LCSDVKTVTICHRKYGDRYRTTRLNEKSNLKITSFDVLKRKSFNCKRYSIW
jgi:hypothetical protein